MHFFMLAAYSVVHPATSWYRRREEEDNRRKIRCSTSHMDEERLLKTHPAPRQRGGDKLGEGAVAGRTCRLRVWSRISLLAALCMDWSALISRRSRCCSLCNPATTPTPSPTAQMSACARLRSSRTRLCMERDGSSVAPAALSLSLLPLLVAPSASVGVCPHTPTQPRPRAACAGRVDQQRRMPDWMPLLPRPSAVQ